MALNMLEHLHGASSVQVTPADDLWQSLHNFLPNPENVVPCLLKSHLPIWQAYVE